MEVRGQIHGEEEEKTERESLKSKPSSTEKLQISRHGLRKERRMPDFLAVALADQQS